MEIWGVGVGGPVMSSSLPHRSSPVFWDLKVGPFLRGAAEPGLSPDSGERLEPGKDL